jgi:Histidine kinase-, DNA gyrase B-, and HSP90-like ATPase
MPDPETRIVNANPTKDFFISMLIKDIGAMRAIIDLVDNSVDGARQLRPNGNYGGLSIEIQTTETFFQISDNCGGIPIELAQNYAFRFGRPSEMKSVPHSIGQFGVGMKRALFKLGKKFRVESITRSSRFVVEEDVEKWKEKEKWEFQFRELEAKRPIIPVSGTGTKIRVTTLHPTIAESFALESFRTSLAEQISEAHIQSTVRGLEIKLNSVSLKHPVLGLLKSPKMSPAYKHLVFKEKDRVDVRIYAGIGESVPAEAGWYVFCNQRQVLSADQTNVTGWGETRGQTVPKYHNQFARFRGYVFFDSKNAPSLPWNTTKTGVDSDSPMYRSTRLEMIKLMRPVIDFLNQLDSEKDQELMDEKPLESTVKAAKMTELDDISQRALFLAPKSSPAPTGPQTARIQYSRPIERVRKVKKVLNARTLTSVGEKTFDYFYKRECED